MFAFVMFLLLEGPKIRRALLGVMTPRNSARMSPLSAQVSQGGARLHAGEPATSIIAGFVVFITLWSLSVPFAFLWALWVALVDFIPQIGGALAGIPTVLFALIHSVPAGVITLVVFLLYTNIENHVLNPVIMSRTVKINPLAVFVAVLVAAEMGSWVDGIFGGFVAVLLAVPAAATLHVLLREVWNDTRSSRGAPTDAPRGPRVVSLVITTDDTLPADVTDRALARARHLIDRAAVPPTAAERATRRRLRRLFRDDAAVGVTITLTDEVMRFTSTPAPRARSAAPWARPRLRGFGTLNLRVCARSGSSRAWRLDSRCASSTRACVRSPRASSSTPSPTALRRQFVASPRAGCAEHQRARRSGARRA